MTEDDVVQTVQQIGHVIKKIEAIPIPTIAAINGAAFGGGLELALACDYRVASDQAVMGLTETSLAIIPGAGGTQRLSRLIGAGQAKRLIFSATRCDARQAFDIGLIEKIESSEQLLDQVFSEATQIASHGPIALRQAKKRS